MSTPYVNPYPSILSNSDYVNVEEELHRLEMYSHPHALNGHYKNMDHDQAIDTFITAWRFACATNMTILNHAKRLQQHPGCIIDGIPFGPPPGPNAHWMFVTSQPYVVIHQWSLDHCYPDQPDTVKVDVKVTVGFTITSAVKQMAMAEWRDYPEVEAEKRTQLRLAITRARLGQKALKQEPRVVYGDGYPRSAWADWGNMLKL